MAIGGTSVSLTRHFPHCYIVKHQSVRLMFHDVAVRKVQNFLILLQEVSLGESCNRRSYMLKMAAVLTTHWRGTVCESNSPATTTTEFHPPRHKYTVPREFFSNNFPTWIGELSISPVLYEAGGTPLVRKGAMCEGRPVPPLSVLLEVNFKKRIFPERKRLRSIFLSSPGNQ